MNTEDMDYYEYEESLKRFTPKKIIKFIFSLIAAVIIILVFAVILLRIKLINIPKSFQGVTWTDNAVTLYENGNFDYITYPLGETYGPSTTKQSFVETGSESTYKDCFVVDGP